MLKVGVSRQRPDQIEDMTAVELLCGAPDLPRSKVLSRWRDQIPVGVACVLCAPTGLLDPHQNDSSEHPLSPLDFALHAWKRVEAARQSLGAATVLVKTGPNFRPTEKNRELLAAFGAAVAQPKMRVVWAPSGLWDPETLQDVALAASMSVATDPVADGSFDPVSDWRYFRIRGLGRARLTRGDIELLAQMIQDSDDGICILASGDATNDVRLARRLLAMVDKDELESG